MIRLVVTLDDAGTLSVQGADRTGAAPPVDVIFGILTAAWVEVLAQKVKAASGIILPHN